MNDYVFHADQWTISFEPANRGAATWAAQWTAVRANPPLVGVQPREPEFNRSGDIGLFRSAAEAALHAKSHWLNLTGPVRSNLGAEFIEGRETSDWHISLSVYVCDMPAGHPIWRFRGRAFQRQVDNASERFGSSPFRFSTIAEAFATADSQLIKRYGRFL